MPHTELSELLGNDRFARLCGITLVEAGKGSAVCRLAVEDKHLNGVNTVQGGAIFTLADLAFAAAANSHGRVAVALSVTMSFMRPALAGDTLTATAREVNLGKTTAVYLVEVTNSAGKPVALFQGTAFRTDKDLSQRDKR